MYPFFWDTLSVLYSVQTGERCNDLRDEYLLKQITKLLSRHILYLVFQSQLPILMMSCNAVTGCREQTCTYRIDENDYVTPVANSENRN